MMEHGWTVLCRKAIMDPQTGNATLVDTIDQINATGAPPKLPTLAPMQMELVSLWYRSNLDAPARGEGRVTLIGPEGVPMGPPQPFLIDLTTFLRARTIAQLPGLPVTGAGMYFFRMELRIEGQEEWRPVARIPVQFTISADQAPAQVAPNAPAPAH